MAGLARVVIPEAPHHADQRAAPIPDGQRKVAGLASLVAYFLLATLILECSCSSAPVKPVNFPFRVSQQRILRTPNSASYVTWSPDGSKIAASSDFGGLVTIWSASGHQISQFSTHAGGVVGSSIAFSANGSNILVAAPDDSDPRISLSILSSLDGKLVSSVIGPVGASGGGTNRTQHFITSADGQFLALATSGTGAVNDEGPVNNIASYSQKGWLLRGGARVYDLITSINFFDHNNKIILGMHQWRFAVLDMPLLGETRIYQAYDQSKFGEHGIGAISGSPDGKYAFVGLDGGILNDLAGTKSQLDAWNAKLSSARIIRLSDGARVASFAQGAPPIWQAAWEPEGRYVAMVDDDGRLILWCPFRPTQGYEIIHLPGREALSVSINPTGDKVAVATDAGVVIFSVIEKG